MSPRHLLPFIALTLAYVLEASPALAWLEVTVQSHGARVEVQRTGSARVTHKVGFRVRGGPLRTFDVDIADKNPTLVATPTLVSTSTAMAARVPVVASAEIRPEGEVRIDIDNSKGVGRGQYELEFTYDVDLLKQGGVRRDGSRLAIQWRGPTWQDGIGNAKVVFAIPSAPMEPKAVQELTLENSDDSLVAPLGGVLSTTTRLPEFDELEMVRPHIAAKEATTWSAYVDLSALGEVTDPRIATAATTRNEPVAPERRIWLLGAGVLMALGFSLLLALKHHTVVENCKRRETSANPTFRIGVAVRVALAGPVVAASIAAQLILTNPLWGSVGVLVACLLASYLPVSMRRQPRGPGRWLPVRDNDAYAERTVIGWLDVSTLRGKLVFVLVTTAWGGLVYGISRHTPYYAYILGLDWIALLTIFATGTQRTIPRPVASEAAQVLRRIRERISAKLPEAKPRTLGRFPNGQKRYDEVRLSLATHCKLPGLVGLEVGVSFTQGAWGHLGIPQVLLRTTADSPCHRALCEMAPTERWVRGRDATERVLVLESPLPQTGTAVQLIANVWNALRKLEDHKADSPDAFEEYSGVRRREETRSGRVDARKAAV